MGPIDGWLFVQSPTAAMITLKTAALIFSQSSLRSSYLQQLILNANG